MIELKIEQGKVIEEKERKGQTKEGRDEGWLDMT